MGSEAGPDLRPHHLQKVLPFCLHAGGPPSHQYAHLGTQPSTETAPQGAQGSRRGPLSNWTQAPPLGGAPASPDSVSSSMSPSVFLGGTSYQTSCGPVSAPPTSPNIADAQKASPAEPTDAAQEEFGVSGGESRADSLRCLGSGGPVGATWGLLLFRHLSAPCSRLLGRTDERPCVPTWCGAQ